MSLDSKLPTLWWYLRRPYLYRDLLRLVRTRMRRGDGAASRKERERARAWCDDEAVDLATALTGLHPPTARRRLAQEHAQDWRRARRAAEACPVSMGGAAHLDLLYSLASRPGTEHVLETGVAYGWSSLALLLALEGQGRGTLYSVDRPYPRIGDERQVGCVVPIELYPRWHLVLGADRDRLPGLLRRIPRLDLAHYDSAKTRSDRLFTYSLIYRHLRPGGILVSDDVGDNLAFRDFARQVGSPPVVVAKPGGSWAGWILKATVRPTGGGA